MMNKNRVVLGVAFSAMIFVWASSFVAIRMGLEGGYSAGGMALLRYIMASIGIWVMYMRLPERQPFSKKMLPGFLGLGGSLAVYNIGLNYGEISVPAGISSFIIGLGPIATTLLAIFWLKESVRKMAWLGMFIGIFGVVIIAAGQHGGVEFDHGVLFLIVAVLSTAVYNVLQKQEVQRFHHFELTCFAVWGCTIGLLIFTPNLVHEISHVTLKGTLATGYLAIFSTVVGYGLWGFCVSRLPMSQVVGSLYSMPLVTVIMGWAALGEFPAILSLIGGVVALFGAFLTSRYR